MMVSFFHLSHIIMSIARVQQIVKEIRIDCDEDTVLLKIEQLGGATCHTGHRSCFHKKIEDGSVKIIGEPVFDPKEIYGK